MSLADKIQAMILEMAEDTAKADAETRLTWQALLRGRIKHIQETGHVPDTVYMTYDQYRELRASNAYYHMNFPNDPYEPPTIMGMKIIIEEDDT